MVSTYGLRPHELWHIDGLPDGHGLITVGVAARHIKVTKTGFRAAVPLPEAWVERYGLGGSNGEARLAKLRCLLRSYSLERRSLPAPIELMRRAELVEALLQLRGLMA